MTRSIALVAGTVAYDDSADYPVASAAAQRFIHELIAALERSRLGPVRLLSLRPVASWPRDRRLFLGRREFALATPPGATTGVYLRFINLGALKALTASVALVMELLRWARRSKGRERIIVAYNIANPPGWAVLLGAWLTGSRSVALMADVQVPGSGDVTASTARTLQYRMQLSALPRFDAVMALSPLTLRDFAREGAGLVMEGGVAADVAAHDFRTNGVVNDGICRLLYAGALTEMAGVDLLLDAFAQLDGTQWQLTITGSGMLAGRVRAAAQRDPRIRYLGFVERADLLREYAAADILVNPHSTRLHSARYVFPSKLLEYLATGRATVTTRAPWSDPEFESHCTILDDESPAALAALLRDVAALPAETRSARAAAARAWVVQAKGWDRQGARIAEYLVALGPRRN